MAGSKKATRELVKALFHSLTALVKPLWSLLALDCQLLGKLS